MNERSKVIGLMARREASNLAKAQRAFSTLNNEIRAAEALEQRLGFLLSQKSSESLASTSAAQLRERRMLTDKLASEGERLRQKVQHLKSESSSAGSQLAQLEHRKRSYDTAAQEALRIEQSERDVRADAATPSRQRR